MRDALRGQRAVVPVACIIVCLSTLYQASVAYLCCMEKEEAQHGLSMVVAGCSRFTSHTWHMCAGGVAGRVMASMPLQAQPDL